MSLEQVSDVTGGRLAGVPAPADVMIGGLATDSRKGCRGKLFVALSGPNFDGHDYVAEASQKGAAAAMLEHETGANIPMVVVDNTLEALGRTAAWWRDQYDIPVVGITGSTGKTTVKDLVGKILSTNGEGVITEGNLNNEIGVPLTLTRLGPHHEFAVIEMGMNHAGEISRLSKMAQPTVAVINNAAAAHLEGLGSIEAVAVAKGEILDGLTDSGVAVLNADDPWFDYWKERAGARQTISFGLSGVADVGARYTERGDYSEIRVVTPATELEIHLPLPGRHNVCNALAAISVATVLDVSEADIVHGLESFDGAAGRLKIIRIAGLTVIDDTYNANPASVAAAIDVLKNYPGSRRALVIGDMGELGDAAADSHHEVGRLAAASNLDRVFAIGPLSVLAVEDTGVAGGHYDDKDLLVEALLSWLKPDDVVLVKGSRAMRMEEIVTRLSGAAERQAPGAGQTGENGDVA